jgi:hypothetical protein
VSAYTDFLSDPGRIEVWLLEVTGLNLETDAPQTFYFSSQRYGTRATDSLANQRYDAMIVSGLERSGEMSGVHGPIAGLMPSRTGGSLVLGQRCGDLDTGSLTQLGGYSIRDFSFGGRRAIVRHGGYSPQLGRYLTYAEFQVVLNGTVDGNPLIEDDRVTFRLATKDRTFEYPIQDRKFWGLDYALHFNGSSAFVDFGNHSEHDFTSDDFTIEFPFMFEANPGANAVIVGRGVGDTDGWEVLINTSGRLVLRTNQSGANQTTTSGVISLGRFYWASLVRDGAAVTIYIDGIASTGVAGTHIDPTSALRTLFLGKNNGGTVFANCIIPELRVWNVARTKEQINTTMHRPLDSSEIDATLVLYAKLDDGTEATASDSSATNADGTITDATWIHSGTGHSDLQGQTLPDCWGPVKGFEPILIDEPRRIYSVSSDRIDSFERIDVGGFSNMVAENALTSFFQFITSATSNGKYDTCICNQGTFIRLGSSPSKPLTVDILGNAPGGTYLENAADQIRYIVCNRGQNRLTDPTDLDTTSFTDFESDVPYAVGHAWTGDASISEVVSYVLASVGSVGYFKRANAQFAVEQFNGIGAKAGVLTITERDVALGSLQCLDRATALSTITLYYQRNYTVLGSGDLLPGVAGTDRERFVKKEWRSVKADSGVVRAEYKDAQTLELESAIDEEVDARAEVLRLGALYDSPDQAFRFLCRQRGFELNRMDAVIFHYQDLSRFGVKQSRFGTADDSLFLVLEASDDVQSGGTWLTLWREEAA